MTQPHLIDQIPKDLRLSKEGCATKDIHMKSSQILSIHLDAIPFDNSFHYRGFIDKMSYLEKGSRPDLVYAVHQCALLLINPRKPHGSDG